MISWNEAISFESIECLYQCIVYIHYDIHYLLLKIYLVGLLRRFLIIKFLFRVAINNLKLEEKKCNSVIWNIYYVHINCRCFRSDSNTLYVYSIRASLSGKLLCPRWVFIKNSLKHCNGIFQNLFQIVIISYFVFNEQFIFFSLFWATLIEQRSKYWVEKK